MKSTPNRKPKVYRLATWKTQYELITRCTSRASTSARNTPAARPSRRISSSTDVAGVDSSRSESSRLMNSPRWMFSIETSRMKASWAMWWSKVSSASRRIASTGSQ